MTTKAKRATDAELEEIALTATPPSGTLDVAIVVEHTMGGLLPNGTPNGLGGSTRYGVGWFDSLHVSAPVAMFDSMKDAMRLANMLAGEEGELWSRKQARKAKIAEIEAAEAATSDTASGGTVKRKRMNHSRGFRGSGSLRQSTSSEKPTVSTQTRLRVEEQALLRPA
jgi:hypothetical protein